MARTKASVGAKVSSGKSSKARCSVAPPQVPRASSSGERSSRGHSSGNPVCPRETPQWQKPITNFFICKDKNVNDSDDDGSDDEVSNSKPKKQNIIYSDDEQEITEDSPPKTESPPKNHVLDESIELEPLTGEKSHKIEEYYQKGSAKGKGVGKKSKGKENIENNKKSKRDFEEIAVEGDREQTSKRIKVN